MIFFFYKSWAVGCSEAIAFLRFDFAVVLHRSTKIPPHVDMSLDAFREGFIKKQEERLLLDFTLVHKISPKSIIREVYRASDRELDPFIIS